MRPRASLLILTLLALLAYSNSLPGAFHFDDYELMLKNSSIAGPTFDYSWFLSHYGGRPLTLWTFHLNYLWGGDDPGGYHLANLLLHIGAGTLLYLTVISFGVPAWSSFLTSAIFLVHPLQSQPVNYIWSRSLLLMAVSLLASILLARRQSPWLALIAFQAAVWSRAEAIVAVPVLWHLLPHSGRRLLAVLGILNLGGIVFGVLSEEPPEFGLAYAAAESYWWSQPWVLLRYLAFFAWPSGLSIEHDFAEVGVLLPIVPGVVILSILLAGILTGPREVRGTLVLGLSWTLLFLLPSAVIANPDVLNESRSYLALAGLSLAASVLLMKLGRQFERGRLCIVIAVITSLTGLTYLRNRVWSTDISLWEDAVRKAPAKSRAHYNLGSALAREGYPVRAEMAFRQASRLNPFDDLSYAGLGFCAESAGDEEGAARYYRQAIELDPENLYAQEGLARVLAKVSLCGY